MVQFLLAKTVEPLSGFGSIPIPESLASHRVSSRRTQDSVVVGSFAHSLHRKSGNQIGQTASVCASRSLLLDGHLGLFLFGTSLSLLECLLLACLHGNDGDTKTKTFSGRIFLTKRANQLEEEEAKCQTQELLPLTCLPSSFRSIHSSLLGANNRRSKSFSIVKSDPTSFTIQQPSRGCMNPASSTFVQPFDQNFETYCTYQDCDTTLWVCSLCCGGVSFKSVEGL